MEKNEGFKLSPLLMMQMLQAVVYGDLMMRCLYRVRPYEKLPGSADALHSHWRTKCIEALTSKHNTKQSRQICRDIDSDFDQLPIHEDLNKPRVGIVGGSSDHLIVDLTRADGYELGDIVRFKLSYGALLAAYTSPNVTKGYCWSAEF